MVMSSPCESPMFRAVAPGLAVAVTIPTRGVRAAKRIWRHMAQCDACYVPGYELPYALV